VTIKTNLVPGKTDEYVSYNEILGKPTSKGSWNDRTKSCTMYSSVQIKVQYSKTGFDENP
jgi:hypothetical protein